MRVGIARITLRFPQALSLKDKRRLLQSLLARVKQEFNVSIAEVDHLDDRRSAVLGVAFVSSDGRLNQSVISRLVSFLERYPDFTVEDYHSEIL